MMIADIVHDGPTNIKGYAPWYNTTMTWIAIGVHSVPFLVKRSPFPGLVTPFQLKEIRPVHSTGLLDFTEFLCFFLSFFLQYTNRNYFLLLSNLYQCIVTVLKLHWPPSTFASKWLSTSYIFNTNAYMQEQSTMVFGVRIVAGNTWTGVRLLDLTANGAAIPVVSQQFQRD